MKFKRPPITNAEAQRLASDTLQRLYKAEETVLRFGRVLEYIYPLATPEQQERMKEILNETIQRVPDTTGTDTEAPGQDDQADRAPD